MTFKCLFGLHSWYGCRCTKCSKKRNKQHSWDGGTCSKCGKTRIGENRCVNCGSSLSDRELASYFQQRLGGVSFGAKSVVSLAGVFTRDGLALCPRCGGLTVQRRY